MLLFYHVQLWDCYIVLRGLNVASEPMNLRPMQLIDHEPRAQIKAGIECNSFSDSNGDSLRVAKHPGFRIRPVLFRFLSLGAVSNIGNGTCQDEITAYDY